MLFDEEATPTVEQALIANAIDRLDEEMSFFASSSCRMLTTNEMFDILLDVRSLLSAPE